MDGRLGQHAVVLELGLAERGSVASNDDELGLAGAEGLEGALVTKDNCHVLESGRCQVCFGVALTLAGLHHKRQLGVDAVRILLALLDGHLDCFLSVGPRSRCQEFIRVDEAIEWKKSSPILNPPWSGSARIEWGHG